MRTVTVDGPWRLYYFPQGERTVEEPAALADLGVPVVPASVPGNVELDLMRAGLLPDLFLGANMRELRRFEGYEWWYETSFAGPAAEAADGERVELVFRGVDCLATYWLNGIEFGRSDNMFVEHRFDVTELLRADSANMLHVRLRSPLLEALGKPYEPSFFAMATNWEQLWIRKAAHGYGWDIFPRALSAGLWRPVELHIREACEITEVYAATVSLDGRREHAVLNVFYRFRADPAWFFDGLELRVAGYAEGSAEPDFEERRPAVFAAGSMMIGVPNPRLWWPHGYGEAHLYELRVELQRHGQVLASRSDRIGIRQAELVRTETTTTEGGGEFLFRVNGTPILCKGSNWVPLDVFHSRDAERLEEALALFRDSGCNIVRCWGGGVYEDHDFFARCDEAGLMVWQDFGMGCALYPQTAEFMESLRREAEAVVRKLRSHPSIVLWCGDNENDEFATYQGLDPGMNRITRELLPQVVQLCDPYRPYLASSPYLSPQTAAARNIQLAPERHLWGPRDYYKSRYYTNSTYHFVSEIGYHGCPNLSSMRRFLTPDGLWPWQDNEEWIAHATESVGKQGSNARRIKLMADQIREMFGEVPDRLEDFIVASQISQAEAKKFFVEMTRLRKWRRTGIIWWNMLDGWPQFSDAVVDYYFGKKLAYHYLKRVQQPFCIMVDEPENWHVTVVAGNDSLAEAGGEYRVWDADSGEVLLEGSYRFGANENRTLGRIRVSHADKRLLLIRWDGREGGGAGANHYLLGFPAFPLGTYRNWLSPIAGLLNDFDAERVGQ